jgi:hypothetical protein
VAVAVAVFREEAVGKSGREPKKMGEQKGLGAPTER